MGNEASQNVCYGEAVDNDISVSWRRIGSSYPSCAREGQAACGVGHKLYVFGGVVQEAGGEVTETNELLCFDAETERWKEVETSGSLPPPCSAATLSAVGDNLYLFGGLNQNKGWMNSLYMLNTATKIWFEVEAKGSPPSPRDKLTSVAIRKKIYYFGGFGPKIETKDDAIDCNGAEAAADDEEEETVEGAQFTWFDDLFNFDTETGCWTQPLHMNLGVPTPRAAHGMCAVGDNLIIFGGRDVEGRKNDLHIFNVVTKKWETKLNVSGRRPEQRSFLTATAVGNRVVVLGGRGLDNQHFADMHIFDLDTRQWLQPSVTGDLPTARGNHSVAVVGDKLVLHGGSSDFSSEMIQCQKHYVDTHLMKTEEILNGGATMKSQVDSVVTTSK